MGSAEESSIVQRLCQGCVGPSRGLEDPKRPLSAPTGVQLVEAMFCLVRFDGILRSSHQTWSSGIMLVVEGVVPPQRRTWALGPLTRKGGDVMDARTGADTFTTRTGAVALPLSQRVAMALTCVREHARTAE